MAEKRTDRHDFSFSLSREMIRDLKQCDTVTFFANGTDKGEIVCIYNEKKDGARKVDGWQVRFPVTTTRVKAATALVCSKWDEYWRTICSLLRPNDEIVLEWTTGHTSDILTKSGLIAYSLHLRIYRNGAPKYYFSDIRLEICGEGSPAAMIKGG